MLNFSAFYVEPVNDKVQYERLNNVKKRGLFGSTHFGNMKINQKVSFENYYWMEKQEETDCGTAQWSGYPMQSLSKDSRSW